MLDERNLPMFLLIKPILSPLFVTVCVCMDIVITDIYYSVFSSVPPLLLAFILSVEVEDTNNITRDRVQAQKHTSERNNQAQT